MPQINKNINTKQYSTGLYSSEYKFDDTMARLKAVIMASKRDFCDIIRGKLDIFTSYFTKNLHQKLDKAKNKDDILYCWELFKHPEELFDIELSLSKEDEVKIIVKIHDFSEKTAKNTELVSNFVKNVSIYGKNFVFYNIVDRVGIRPTL